jgi:prevent-host-death family protein
METVNIHYAKTHLSSILERVENGEEIIIARKNKPIVKLESYNKPKKERIPGLFQGQMKMVGTWEELDKEISDAFEESEIFPK